MLCWRFCMKIAGQEGSKLDKINKIETDCCLNTLPKLQMLRLFFYVRSWHSGFFQSDNMLSLQTCYSWANGSHHCRQAFTGCFFWELQADLEKESQIDQLWGDTTVTPGEDVVLPYRLCELKTGRAGPGASWPAVPSCPCSLWVWEPVARPRLAETLSVAEACRAAWPPLSGRAPPASCLRSGEQRWASGAEVCCRNRWRSGCAAWARAGGRAPRRAPGAWGGPSANGLGPCFELVILPWSHTTGCQTSLTSCPPQPWDGMLDTVSTHSRWTQHKKTDQELELTQDSRPLTWDYVCPHQDHLFWSPSLLCWPWGGSSSLYLPYFLSGRKLPCSWG